MSRVTRKLKKRLSKGNLPIAYNLYNETDVNDVSTTITANCNLGPDRRGQLLIFEKGEKMLRIRKLTEGECYRLMGFEKKDTEACRAVGQSKTNIYHQAGDSIVTTVLVGLFGELIGADYHKAISDYADKLSEEVK